MTITDEMVQVAVKTIWGQHGAAFVADAWFAH